MDTLRSTYLAARTGYLDIGIDALCIRRVLPMADWDGPEPFDLDQFVQEHPSDKAKVMVLVLDEDDAGCAVSTGYPLVVRELGAAHLFELPSVLRPGFPSVFLRLAREPGAPPLLILDHRGSAPGSEPGRPT